MIPWYFGAVQNHGTWYRGIVPPQKTMVLHGMVLPWYGNTMVFWGGTMPSTMEHGTMVILWYFVPPQNTMVFFTMVYHGIFYYGISWYFLLWYTMVFFDVGLDIDGETTRAAGSKTSKNGEKSHPKAAAAKPEVELWRKWRQ